MNKRKIQWLRIAWLPAGALTVLSAVLALNTVQAAEPVDGLRMKFVVESAHGDLLEQGRYVRAGNYLANTRNQDSYEVKTNLCVARVMSGQFRYAQYPCQRAIELAEEAVRKAPVGSRYQAYASLGDAYNNRGVLHAMMGEEEKALEKLTAAASLPVMCDCAARNLARLRVALDDAIASR